jgi:hypothetical protein
LVGPTARRTGFCFPEFMISAAVMATFAVLLASAPAKADFNYGPVQNANQCWKNSPTSKEFG